MFAIGITKHQNEYKLVTSQIKICEVTFVFVSSKCVVLDKNQISIYSYIK